MIKSEELGEVVTKLDQSCPEALDKKTDGRDELEINIDAIDSRTFHVLDRLVSGAALHPRRARGKEGDIER